MVENNNSKKFGDFEEVVDESQQQQQTENPEAPARVKMPRNGEIIGRIVQRLGGNRMEIICTDGKTRNCRVPGRYKRKLWLRPKDIVLIKPWEYDDSKGDVIFKYHGGQINQLQKRGILDSIKDEF